MRQTSADRADALFVPFDGGIKKVLQVDQHFGIKAAEQLVHEPKGGTIWRTRGSGKSIVMVLLARWLLQDNRMRGWW